MKYLKYLISFLSLAIGYIGIYKGGVYTWFLPIYAFVFIPLVELVFEGSKENLTKEEEKIALEDRIFDWLIYLVVPVHYGLLVLFLFSVNRDMPWWELFGMIMTLGISCGVYGINVAHELGHRVKKYEQFLAKTLLLSSQYMHFFIEHNRGHHKRVSTDDDPASSRKGEYIYVFWVRSVLMGYKSAWELEAFKLKKQGRSVVSIYNEMIWYTIIQFSFVITISLLFSWFVAACYVLSAVVGFLLLETVNYIEHYGLRRKKGKSGYDKVAPIHSWNSNHPLGRAVLFELSRHSDHHFRANRKYQILRYHDKSPQMPTGYPGMMMLSLVPPLWFYIMNDRVDQLRSEYDELV